MIFWPFVFSLLQGTISGPLPTVFRVVGLFNVDLFFILHAYLFSVIYTYLHPGCGGFGFLVSLLKSYDE